MIRGFKELSENELLSVNGGGFFGGSMSIELVVNIIRAIISIFK